MSLNTLITVFHSEYIFLGYTVYFLSKEFFYNRFLLKENLFKGFKFSLILSASVCIIKITLFFFLLYLQAENFYYFTTQTAMFNELFKSTLWYSIQLIFIKLFIFVNIYFVFDLNKKNFLNFNSNLIGLFYMLLSGCIYAIITFISEFNLFNIFFAAEAIMGTINVILLIYYIKFSFENKTEKKKFFFLIFFIGLNGILSTCFFSSISLIEKFYGTTHLFALSTHLNLVPGFLYENLDTLEIFWMIFWLFYFFLIKLYFFPFQIVYKNFLSMLPDHLFLFNIIVLKVTYIYFLYRLFYFLHPLLGYKSIESLLIIITIVSYIIATLQMFQEKKIKDFIIYSSLSNNAIIVFYLIFNVNLGILSMLILTLYFYIFAILSFFYFKNLLQKDNIIYFSELQALWPLKSNYPFIYIIFFVSFFILAALAPTQGFIFKYLGFYEIFIKSNVQWFGFLLPWTFLNSLAYINVLFYIFPKKWKKI